MKPRHAAALAFIVLVFLGGCALVYYPDPSIHIAGWKCPEPDKMNHFVAYEDPPCAWIPGGVLRTGVADFTRS